MENIRRDRPVALYYQLKTIIREQIENGELQPGDMLPSENELMKRYGVSRTTVRQAVGDLVYEKVLERMQGKGTFVALQKLQQHLVALTSFSEDISALGLQPSSRQLQRGLSAAPIAVLAFFGLPEGSQVFTLRRTRCVEGEPVGVHTVYLPEDIANHARLWDVDFSSGISLYQTLEAWGIVFGEAEETLEAAAASEDISRQLGIAQGSPVLWLDRLSYSPAGRPLEYNHMVYRSDRYKYKLRLPRLRR